MIVRFPALAALALLAASTAVADEVPELTGTWVMVESSAVVMGELGHAEPTTEPTFGQMAGIWTIIIEQQQGRAFSGTRASENHTETLIGTIGYDGRSIYMVDEDTHLLGRLLDDGRMEICAMETGGGSMVAACTLSERQ